MNSHETTLGQDAHADFSEHSVFPRSQAFLNKSSVEWSPDSPPQKTPSRQIDTDVTFQPTRTRMAKVIHMAKVQHVTTASSSRGNSVFLSEAFFSQGPRLPYRNCYRSNNDSCYYSYCYLLKFCKV